MAYPAQRKHPNPSPDELRARIPGWGADLDHADRPAYPQERFAPEITGAHWDLPDQQIEHRPRERSIEHASLTPVFGTAQPLHGVSGAIRRFAYARFSEGLATHFLLLILADRVEATGAHLRSLFTLRPDNPITETGILGELRRRPLASRFGRGRVDLRHTWMDPIIVAAPWVLGAWAVVALARRIFR
ncbi:MULTISPECIES: hypothetical protein [unclassified Microbacterium]|uniref:hypothetical protein n=1 Tax=unclassified Microbacterium TaxID=2609290 RepID=UPI003746B63B